MRKILSLIAAILFAGSMMAEVGSLYYTFLPYKPSSGAVSDYTKTGTMTIDEMHWTVPGNWYGNGALRLGGKSIENVDREIISQDPMGSAISKIRIAHAGKTADAITLNSVTVTTASDAEFTQNVTTKTVTDFTVAKNTKDTIDVVPATEPWATNSYYKIAFNFTNANGSNYAFVVEKILFYAYASGEGGGEDPQPEPTAQTLYLTLSSDWAGWPAKYAMYYFDEETNGWSDFMTAVEGAENTYVGTIPANYSSVIFVRLNGDAAEANWDNKWSQTVNLTIPADKDLFTVTSGGTGDACDGTWSVYDAGGEDPEPPTPVLANGYYLVGDFAGVAAWAPVAERMFSANPDNEAEMVLANVALAVEDSLKVVYVENDAIVTWYPVDAPNYVVDAAHAGEKDIYFRADGQGGDDWYYHTIYIAENVEPQPEPVLANGYYLVGDFAGVAAWAPVAERMFSSNPDNEAEMVLANVALAVEDSLKVVYVENDAIVTWYPVDAPNYVVDAAHAGEKAIYFRADGQGGDDWYYHTIFIAENVVPVADFTQPFTLKFNGTGNSGSDASAAFAAEVAAIFDAASAPYVTEVTEATKVYAGRPIADDNSSVKFGTTSAQGTLAFTLAQAIEVDSIVVNATQYGNNASKITVNGTEFDLNAGNKVPQNVKITPAGEISAITIAQSSSERMYLRYVAVYPKQGGVDPQPQPLADGFYLVGTMNEWTPAAEYKFAVNPDNEAEMVLASVTLAENAELKVRQVENGEATAWFPAEAGNYIVDAAHAGLKDIYFRADYQGAEDWYAGCIYIAANSGSALINTEAAKVAVKQLRKGMVIIRRGDREYSIMGQLVK